MRDECDARAIAGEADAAAAGELERTDSSALMSREIVSTVSQSISPLSLSSKSNDSFPPLLDALARVCSVSYA